MIYSSDFIIPIKPIERDDHSISEAESDTEEPELQVVNMYGSSENLPVTNDDITEASAERDEDIVSKFYEY